METKNRLNTGTYKGIIFLIALFLPVVVLCQTFDPAKMKEELHKALNNAEIEKVKKIIENDVSLIEASNPKGSTPLTVAAADGHTDLVKYLINKGAKINTANNFGNTPLHYAGWAADYDSFKMLFENGADLKAINTQGHNPFHYAFMGGNKKIVKYCMSKGMDIKKKCDDGSSIIHWAAYGGNLELFKFLESEGLDPAAKDREGSPPFFWAASGNRAEIMKYLVDKKIADVNEVDEQGNCALGSAISRGNLEATKYLLDNGADIDHKPDDNETWLHLAAQSNNTDLVRLLIDRNGDLNAFNNRGQTPIHIATSHGNPDVVKLLAEKGAKINPGICKRSGCDNSGGSPLHYAAWHSPDIVEFFLSKGADPDAKNEEGKTPLHNAARSDQVKCLDILCAKTKNINVKSKYGETPLHLAIKAGKIDNIKILLEKGADVNESDNESNTPLHLASIKGSEEILDLLLKKGADIDAKNKKDKTPVYYAVYYGNRSIADKLIKKGADKEDLPYKKAGLLNRDPGAGEASIWYLDHSGFAINTKDHFLIFDYWQRDAGPATPSVNNGHIDPEEIKDKNVLVFVSHTHRDHYDKRIFDWKDKIDNITYIMGFETNDIEEYIYIPPGEHKKVNNVKISTIKSTDTGEGFMVQADGLTILHPGDHANRYQKGEDKEFYSEVDHLAKNYSDIDIAFLPVTGCGFRDKVALFEGNDYIIKKFNPSIAFPMHGAGNEQKYKEYAEDCNKKGFNTKFYYTLNKGDRLLYSKEKYVSNKGKDTTEAKVK